LGWLNPNEWNGPPLSFYLGLPAVPHAPARPLDNIIIDISHRESLTGSPRSFADYRVAVHRDRLPNGVELIEPCH
jgi:hypothetical protein